MSDKVLAALRHFYAGAPDGVDPGDGFVRALRLFYDLATTVPAYRSFLSERGLDLSKVVSAADSRLYCC